MLSKSFLLTPIQYIKGVGPRLSERFGKKGISTVGDLLHFLPRTYRDQKIVTDIHNLVEGQYVVMEGEVFDKKSLRRFKGKGLYAIELRTSTGVVISLKYFKLPFKGFLDSIEIGQTLKIGGNVYFYNNQPEFRHPDFLSDDVKDEGLVSIYSEIENINQVKIRKTINHIFEELDSKGDDFEILPLWIRKDQGLMSYKESLKDIHQPALFSPKEYFNYQALSQKTLIFHEFFFLQLHLCLKKLRIKNHTSPSLKGTGQVQEKLKNSLPFELTTAQNRVFDEIKLDMGKDTPMGRLLQGDVGSGKTLVAFMATSLTFESGYQTALMAPTEILAEQHFQTAKKWFEPTPISVELLTSKIQNKSKILEKIQLGTCNLCIGTHALIQEQVQFNKLGLVIIDEQHRFGVEQRNKLIEKGDHPHFLVMTATPIPRSLAMTLYGDLDISIIDELPKGRKPITTKRTRKRRDVFEFMVKEVLKGRQAYVVYPLVEESEVMDLKNATEQFEKLKKSFSSIRWGLLHGRMNLDEKSQIMQDFVSGQIQVLVTTTVIEVGVDVPNANVMVIEHCERFGLSQLHQLRGRIGRGHHKSYCILVLGTSVSDESLIRSKIMEQTEDGFRIANEDLKLRGAGEFLGTKQSGLMHFRLANLNRDVDLLQQARRAAQTFIDIDPNFEEEASLKLKEKIYQVSKIRQS